MTDFEEIMSSYGLDPSDPDNLDELMFRICSENDDFIDESVELLLSEYSDLNEFYEEYDDDEWVD